MKLSKYVYVADGADKENKLLYNSKTDYLIKYNKTDFGEVENLFKYGEILTFLKEKEFLESEEEEEILHEQHEKALLSEDTLMLILKITKGCNFRCTYCYEDLNGYKMSEDNQKAIVRYIEKKLAEGVIKNVIINWFGGEPTMNMECIINMGKDIYRICKKYDVEYISGITTNGYLLNEKNVEALYNAHVSVFQVTIDGGPEIHDTQRVLADGRGTFQKIYENLKKLKEMSGEYKVVLRTNISRKMLGNMRTYVELMKEFFLDERFSAVFHPVVNFEDMSHEVSDEEVLKEVINAMREGFVFAPLTEFLSLDSSFCYGIKENHYVIDTNLDVTKCTAVNEPYSIVGKISLEGELIPNSFMNVWRGARVSEKCKGCENFAGCGGGACSMYYLKRGESRCMKYREKEQIEKLLQITDLQEQYDVYIHL